MIVPDANPSRPAPRRSAWLRTWPEACRRVGVGAIRWWNVTRDHIVCRTHKLTASRPSPAAILEAGIARGLRWDRQRHHPLVCERQRQAALERRWFRKPVEERLIRRRPGARFAGEVTSARDGPGKPSRASCSEMSWCCPTTF